MNSETATLCSYCRCQIAGDQFVIATSASVLRLHAWCVGRLVRDLDQWVFRGQQKSFALDREFPIAVFMLGLLPQPASTVLELAAGLNEWICEYEKSRVLAAPKEKGAE